MGKENAIMNCHGEKNKSTTGISRRTFMGNCAMGGCATYTLASTISTFVTPSVVQSQEPQAKTKIRLCFAYPSPESPIWPNIHYDFEGHDKEFLEKLQKVSPGIEYFPVAVMSADDAKKVVEKDAEVDGYLIYFSGCLWGNCADIITDTGKPTVIADHPFAGSGEFLMSFGRTRRAGKKVLGVSSTKVEDVAQAVRCIHTLKQLSTSSILVVGADLDPRFEQFFGTKMVSVPFAELNNAYNRQLGLEKAGTLCKEWMEQAEKVIEPSAEELGKSAAMYLAMRDVLNAHNSQGITINCLGGFYGGHIHAYPCLGFMQLDDEGSVGGCEADQRSAFVKLMMSYQTGRPGFISDPVIDTSKNQIIYAHCVAPTKVYGPDGSRNPYHLRSHSEDRQGACDRSLMPLGEMTTTIEVILDPKEILFHQGKTVENVDEDMACRNKLAVEVKGDVFKLMEGWDTRGWHRVTFYGDYKQDVYNLAYLTGFKVVEEA